VVDDSGGLRGRAAPTDRSNPAQRRRVLPLDETTALVTEAQQVLAVITERQQADAERPARGTAEAARAEELARWAEQDQADDVGADDAAELDDAGPARER
jgi:hypothetical protein